MMIESVMLFVSKIVNRRVSEIYVPEIKVDFVEWRALIRNFESQHLRIIPSSRPSHNHILDTNSSLLRVFQSHPCSFTPPGAKSVDPCRLYRVLEDAQGCKVWYHTTRQRSGPRYMPFHTFQRRLLAEPNVQYKTSLRLFSALLHPSFILTIPPLTNSREVQVV